jgi:hypothetical protein
MDHHFTYHGSSGGMQNEKHTSMVVILNIVISHETTHLYFGIIQIMVFILDVYIAARTYLRAKSVDLELIDRLLMS